MAMHAYVIRGRGEELRPKLHWDNCINLIKRAEKSGRRMEKNKNR